ncbi:MAG TPA: nucleotidyltransferase domain-containing protein [Luteibacter sp.]|jgi:predicted nucleotidyltransferase|nr:nucleotidyltransferase domain-containing protein [Luteibacter sp.]
MADALFTATQQRVLALLFGQPGRSFFTKELIDLAEGGSGAVQRELGRLQHSGLVTQTLVGNQKHYRANAEAPVFAELCSIVSKMLGPAGILREALLPVADDISIALLYGSVAGHRDTASSDIDVLVVSAGLTLEQVYEILAPAEKKLGRPVNPTLFTQAEFDRRLSQRNPFLVKLLAGELVTLLGSKDALATGWKS